MSARHAPVERKKRRRPDRSDLTWSSKFVSFIFVPIIFQVDPERIALHIIDVETRHRTGQHDVLRIDSSAESVAKAVAVVGEGRTATPGPDCTEDAMLDYRCGSTW
jgi:hypothetical protein